MKNITNTKSIASFEASWWRLMVNVASVLSTRDPLNEATHAILAPTSKYDYNNCYYF